MSSVHEPSFVALILESSWTWHFARVALVLPFIVSGVGKLIDFRGAVEEQEHFGMPAPVILPVLTTAVEIIGSTLVIFNHWIWLAAGALGIFTALTALVGHAYWTKAGRARFLEMNSFMEHIGLIGGFILLAILAK